MSRRRCLGFGILALLATVPGRQHAYAQSLNCPDRQSQVSATAQNIKVTIADVEFSGENSFSDATREELLKNMNELDLRVIREGDDSDWLSYLEVPVRETLQKQGYFRVFVRSTPYLIRAEAQERHYVVNVEIDAGPQYRLDEIHFSGVTEFAQAELRAQFSLQHGDLFDVPELRKGMESLTRLYSSKGFIDMVPEPQVEIDETNLLLNVVFKIDEGRQYHVGAVEIRGLDQQAEQALNSQLRPGQVFDVIAFRNFFEQHKAGLPSPVSLDNAIQIHRDGTNFTVDLSVDIRPCPRT